MDDPSGNKMLLVMDYMEGGPVMTREALERGRCIPESLACQYFRDMCKVGSPPSSKPAQIAPSPSLASHTVPEGHSSPKKHCPGCKPVEDKPVSRQPCRSNKFQV